MCVIQLYLKGKISVQLWRHLKIYCFKYLTLLFNLLTLGGQTNQQLKTHLAFSLGIFGQPSWPSGEEIWIQKSNHYCKYSTTVYNGHPRDLEKVAVWKRCLIKLRFKLVVDVSNWPLLTGGRYSQVVGKSGLIRFYLINNVAGSKLKFDTWLLLLVYFLKVTTLIVTLAKLPPSVDLKPPAIPDLYQTASKYLDGLDSMTSEPDWPSLKLHRVSSIIYFVEVKSKFGKTF